jgi:DNA-binding protein HU-beta
MTIKKKEVLSMNKLQLTEAVAQKAGIPKNKAAEAVNAVLDVIADALAAGDDVKITGFGGFEVKERAARTGRNPRTGEAVEIAASKYVAFSAGSSLKDKVNG